MKTPSGNCSESVLVYLFVKKVVSSLRQEPRHRVLCILHTHPYGSSLNPENPQIWQKRKNNYGEELRRAMPTPWSRWKHFQESLEPSIKHSTVQNEILSTDNWRKDEFISSCSFTRAGYYLRSWGNVPIVLLSWKYLFRLFPILIVKAVPHPPDSGQWSWG